LSFPFSRENNLELSDQQVQQQRIASSD